MTRSIDWAGRFVGRPVACLDSLFDVEDDLGVMVLPAPSIFLLNGADLPSLSGATQWSIRRGDLSSRRHGDPTVAVGLPTVNMHTTNGITYQRPDLPPSVGTRA